jgi:hypothetical protein
MERGVEDGDLRHVRMDAFHHADALDFRGLMARLDHGEAVEIRQRLIIDERRAGIPGPALHEPVSCRHDAHVGECTGDPAEHETEPGLRVDRRAPGVLDQFPAVATMCSEAWRRHHGLDFAVCHE